MLRASTVRYLSDERVKPKGGTPTLCLTRSHVLIYLQGGLTVERSPFALKPQKQTRMDITLPQVPAVYLGYGAHLVSAYFLPETDLFSADCFASFRRTDVSIATSHGSAKRAKRQR